ncbi:glycine oxidase ThiO [Nocardioides gansuensis]|uniref:Glycine oxidase ThiO n=1 Tax=Nocardioides gansuensis TaxID=2138300 RepID=A0A2T8F7W5_9ACTN|nr:glycine oxidase ThiO [Nocardioides gansuensis]
MRILGAGIVGLACADELVGRGHDVVVVDPAPGSGASFAAAGMLCPGGEAWHGEDDLLALCLEGVALWPEYAGRLGVPLTRTGTLLVGRDHGDLQLVERQAELLAGAGVAIQPLTRRELLAAEPGLDPRAAGGAVLPHDQAVDPRAVVAALLARLGERVVSPGSPAAVPAEVEVLATGARLPAPYDALVRGVRGEILRVATDDPPAHVVRGWARGEPVYVVPRPGTREVVIGATSEEHDEPPVATVGGVRRLLLAAVDLVPALDRAELVEVTARDRPGTPDNLPLVGPSGDDGVLLAAGHHRHGVLLAPLTAVRLADHLESGAVDARLDPRRFSPSPPTTEGSTR